MGDCRLRILVSQNLVSSLRSNHDAKKEDEDGATTTKSREHDDRLCPMVSRTLSADTTLKELLEQTEAPCHGGGMTLQQLLNSSRASVWDCTVFPATDITDQCEGNGNMTLYTAGWFPSGTLQILPADAKTAITGKADIYDDQQYNNSTGSSTEATNVQGHQARVQLAGASARDALPAPSQVLHSVTQRFDANNDSSADQMAAAARRTRQQNQIDRRQAEQARARKLEERIRKLQQGDGKKKKTVSEQVRRMLIKSRATGRTDLRMEDRVFLHCILWSDGGQQSAELALKQEEDYRYFSRQDIIGRALASFDPAPKMQQYGREAEMLVSIPTTTDSSSSNQVYRRLPVGMRFYEALEESYLSDSVDTVVIRWFDPNESDATTSITERNDIAEEELRATPTHPRTVDVKTVTPAAAATANVSAAIQNTDTAPLSKHLNEILRKLDEQNGSAKKKATAIKVRQMKMKSTAKGDTKRVKMTDRFFVELITVVDEGTARAENSFSVAAVSPVFVAKSDTIGRLLRDCEVAALPRSSARNLDWSWELLAPAKKADDAAAYTFKRIASSNDNELDTWDTAERGGFVQSFDRILLRYYI